MSHHTPAFFAASYLVLLRNDLVLLQLRSHTGWMDNFWGLPAGHVEGTESMSGAIRREAKEEIHIELLDADTKLAHVMHRVSTDRVYFDFFFIATVWNGEIQNVEPDKHDKLAWFQLNSLPPNTIPYIKRAIDRIGSGIFFSEDVTE